MVAPQDNVPAAHLLDEHVCLLHVLLRVIILHQQREDVADLRHSRQATSTPWAVDVPPLTAHAERYEGVPERQTPRPAARAAGTRF